MRKMLASSGTQARTQTQTKNKDVLMADTQWVRAQVSALSMLIKTGTKFLALDTTALDLTAET